MNTEDIEAAVDVLLKRVIAYNPAWAVVMGGGAGGIVLSQLIYHARDYGWQPFWHTDKQLIHETGLSRKTIKLAKAKLKDLPFVSLDLRGVPPKTFYTIDRRKLFDFAALGLKNGVFSEISQLGRKGPIEWAERAHTCGTKGTNIRELNKREGKDILPPVAATSSIPPKNSGKCQRLFHKAYEAKHKHPYPDFNGVGGVAIQAVWKASGYDMHRYKQLLQVFIEDEWAAGDVKLFRSKLPQWIKLADNPPANGNGHTNRFANSIPAPIAHYVEDDGAPIEW